jgi:hypothetical protein
MQERRAEFECGSKNVALVEFTLDYALLLLGSTVPFERLWVCCWLVRLRAIAAVTIALRQS